MTFQIKCVIFNLETILIRSQGNVRIKMQCLFFSETRKDGSVIMCIVECYICTCVCLSAGVPFPRRQQEAGVEWASR